MLSSECGPRFSCFLTYIRIQPLIPFILFIASLKCTHKHTATAQLFNECSWFLATVNLPYYKTNGKKRLIGSLSNAIWLMWSVRKMLRSWKKARNSQHRVNQSQNKTTYKYYCCPAAAAAAACFILFLVFFYTVMDMKKANAPNNFVLFLFFLSGRIWRAFKQ